MGRLDASLEICHPDEQHGFRPNRGLEQHLLTTNTQSGQIFRESDPKKNLIKIPVRQGCVESAFVCTVLQKTMGVWRVTVSGNHGFDLRGDLPQLSHPRFADDILLFAGSAAEAAILIDFLVEEFASAGLFF